MFRWSLFAIILLASSALAAMAQEEAEEYPLIPGCTWKNQTVLINGKENQKLSFRMQDCDNTAGAKVTFALDHENRLIQSWEDGAHTPVARFWPLNGRKPSRAVEEIARPYEAENEKGRCIVHLDYEKDEYSYEPKADYLEELLAVDEPFAACGEYGATNDGIQYFTVIDNVLLGFMWVGQDTPLFDPASFRYRNSERLGAAE